MKRSSVTLFLGGDVMTGRGIDQILPYPSAPPLHEQWMKDAGDYVTLAEQRNGPIPRSVAAAYVWGDALDLLERQAPDARIINLETSVTTSDHFQADKGIHYRMHPDNLPCLNAAAIDCCVLANNHVLDWGRQGLLETLEVLARAGIATAGAGHNELAARAPAVLDSGAGGRLLVFACGLGSSGIPKDWAATGDQPGVNRFDAASDTATADLMEHITALRQAGDLVVLSVHWGGNWGYRIVDAHRTLARKLIDAGAVDVVHGHSSHHPLAVEIYRDRPILYGCGDLLNDYEGIHGYEDFRPDLAFGYLVTLERASGDLLELRLVPVQIRHFRLNRCVAKDVRWLARRLAQQSRPFGVTVELDGAELLVAAPRQPLGGRV